MEIQLDGQVTRVLLNGEKINEFIGSQNVPQRKQWFEPVRGPRPESGYIGLQNHDKNSTVYFKEVSVVPLDNSTPLSQGDRDHMLSYLHSTRKQVLDSVAGLSANQLKFKSAPDRWSVAEVVEHLTLSEQNLFANAMNGLIGKEPVAAKSLRTNCFTALLWVGPLRSRPRKVFGLQASGHPGRLRRNSDHGATGISNGFALPKPTSEAGT